ncbi:MAG TPA: glycosyltransferase [Candidatus Acidoferrum sp.]|nr:glycosyltransferase [Candidatus Acidoferrum sp.]
MAQSSPSAAGALESPSGRVLEGLVERDEFGMVVLSPARGRPSRRMLYLDSYGGRAMWQKIKRGEMPPHHLRGCLELARQGYEVALAEPLPDFYFNRRALPHDLRLLKLVRRWLGNDGIVFCGHNVLYWLLLLKKLGLIRCRIVSNLWAREPLNLARYHSGIVGLTRAGAEQARKLAPGVKVAPLGWGADLSVYPRLPYRPEAFFSCGIALRDFKTLSLAAARCRQKIEVLCPGMPKDVVWPENVKAIDSGQGWNFEEKRVTYQQLLHNHYGRSAGSLIIVKKDPAEYVACGFTEIIEVMAMARPVIMTRTGALPTEIDIEKAGCGLFVPPEDPEALANAIDALGNDPERASAMGEKGRELAESYYNIERYANDLRNFFESL